MAVWWQFLVLFFCTLNCVQSSAPSPLLQRNKYNDSFHLTRSTRTHVQQLKTKYIELRLGSKNFEDRSRQLKDLPLLSTDFYSWLLLTDGERLHAAFWDLQTYRDMLEWKRKQLEKEERQPVAAGQVVRSTLAKSFEHIELNLRDLMSQINSQMRYIQRSQTKPTSPTARAHLVPESSTDTVWDSRVEGYIILRDLDLFLIKLAREFLLLLSKTHVTQH